MRPCFKIKASAGANKPAVIELYEEIGFWGVQAKDFADQIKAIDGNKVRVEINSPGGDVMAGIAMYNILVASGKEIETVAMGVAASAASVVFMAGSKRSMPANSFLMLHNPWTIVAGNADELRDTADTLDKIGTSLLATYTSRSGMKAEDLTPLMKKDTWFTADEAKTNGLATDVSDAIEAQASFDLARADLPANVAKVYAKAKPAPAPNPKAETPAPAPTNPPADPPAEDEAAKEPVTPEQVTAQAKTAGLEAHAKVLSIKCGTKGALTTALAHATEVVALCKLAEQPGMASAAIKADTPVAELRAKLLDKLADKDEHVTNTPPQNKSKPGENFSASGYWASRDKSKADKAAASK